MAKGQKTHKATAKRFKVSKKGKLLHKKQYDNQHLKANKTNKTKKRQTQRGELSSRSQAKKLKQLIS